MTSYSRPISSRHRRRNNRHTRYYSLSSDHRHRSHSYSRSHSHRSRGICNLSHTYTRGRRTQRHFSFEHWYFAVSRICSEGSRNDSLPVI